VDAKSLSTAFFGAGSKQLFLTEVKIMARIGRGLLVLFLVAGVGFLSGADKAQKKKKAETYIVTAKELAQEFSASPGRAKNKYSENKNKPAAKIEIDGVVSKVDEKESTVTLEGTDKVSILLKAKKISGEKAGKRLGISKGAEFKEFVPKKQVVLECDEIKLEKYPDVK
jgi:hypothetical protein